MRNGRFGPGPAKAGHYRHAKAGHYHRHSPASVVSAFLTAVTLAKAVRPTVAIMAALILLVAPAYAQTPPPMEAVTLEQAVERAIKNNPTIAQTAQGILRAEGLLQQARSATMPFATANVNGVLNSTERRFDDVITSPRTQGTLSAQFGVPVLAASRWAAATQARDQVEIADLSTAEERTNIAVATAQAYLAIIAQKRQVEVSLRSRETSMAHLDYARRRLEAGAGTRLNEVRAGQEVSTNDARVENAQLGVRRAQEALGVLIAANGPVDAASEPVFNIPAGPIEAEAGWMAATSRLAAVRGGRTRGRSRVA